MTGPEHYQEAERLLAAVEPILVTAPREDVRAMYELAQVHATLALAAAVALGSGRALPEDGNAWLRACSEVL